METPVLGWKKLTKKELCHLIDQQALEHDAFIRTIKHQKKDWDDHDNKPVHCPCWDCYMIAKKLHLWDTV